MAYYLPLERYYFNKLHTGFFIYFSIYLCGSLLLMVFICLCINYFSFEYITLIQRILVDKMKLFKEEAVNKHIPHKYSEESAHKSKLVSTI